LHPLLIGSFKNEGKTMAANQIILKPVDAYEVTTKDGESLGQFIRGKSWNGMSELRNGGEVIIIEDGCEFLSMLDGLFSTGKSAKTVYVIKACPRVMDALIAKKTPEPVSSAAVVEGGDRSPFEHPFTNARSGMGIPKR
jgi:hypothetical protein